MSSRSKRWLAAAAALALLALAPLAGGESLSWSDIFREGTPSHRIVFELRLPRLVLAAVAGGALAVLGGCYQVLFHNALAEPYVLGVSSAVALGAGLTELTLALPPGASLTAANGLGAAAAVTVFLLLMSRRSRGGGSHGLLLFGMGLNFVLSSALFLALSYHQQHAGSGGMRWFFGNIPWASGAEAWRFAALCLPCLAALWVLARRLDALGLGDGVARTLGVDPTRSRAWILALTSGCLAWIVVHTGSIGFVGLVVPHAVRRLGLVANSRGLVTISFVVGAAFLVLADVLSRAILPPFEFPVGIVTTLVGGPLFLLLLWRGR